MPQRKLVLILDNVDAKLYETLFKRAGINAVGIDSGVEALKWLGTNKRPRLILTDMALGGEIGDGITFTQQVRARHKTVAIWLISGHPINDEIKAIARKAGISRFIEKSFDFEGLIEEVKEELK